MLHGALGGAASALWQWEWLWRVTLTACGVPVWLRLCGYNSLHGTRTKHTIHDTINRTLRVRALRSRATGWCKVTLNKSYFVRSTPPDRCASSLGPVGCIMRSRGARASAAR